jgi:hypothetical protein
LVARRWWEDNREPLVTTDFVLDELLTLLKSRGNAQRAIALGRDLLDGSLGRLERVTEDDLHAAWLLFRAHQLQRLVLYRLHKLRRDAAVGNHHGVRL